MHGAQNFTEGVTYDNVPYPKDMLAAVANIDEDYPGSCGRCYEVRSQHWDSVWTAHVNQAAQRGEEVRGVLQHSGCVELQAMQPRYQ